MELLKNYNQALQAIYDHVGFVEDWVVYPIDDRTDKYWLINDSEVVYHEDKQTVIDMDGNHYANEIYTQRFYQKHVYKGEKITLIFVDTHTDGNKFFAIYDNEKEIKQ